MIEDMNKRSIITAVLALGLGITALTGCSSNSGANYVTPSNVGTITNTIAETESTAHRARDL